MFLRLKKPREKCIIQYTRERSSVSFGGKGIEYLNEWQQLFFINPSLQPPQINKQFTRRLKSSLSPKSRSSNAFAIAIYNVRM